MTCTFSPWPYNIQGPITCGEGHASCFILHKQPAESSIQRTWHHHQHTLLQWKTLRSSYWLNREHHSRLTAGVNTPFYETHPQVACTVQNMLHCMLWMVMDHTPYNLELSMCVQALQGRLDKHVKAKLVHWLWQGFYVETIHWLACQ